MRNFLFLFVLSSSLMIAQSNSESKEENFESLNSISKSSVETHKSVSDFNSRQIPVKTSTTNARFLQRRNTERKSSFDGIGSLSISVYASSNTKRKNKASNNNIALLKNSLSDEEIKNTVKFNDATEIPVFKSCKNKKGDKRLSCFNKQMSKHIEKNSNDSLDAFMNKSEVNLWVSFIIDKEGNVNNIKTLGPKGAQVLNNEAVRLASKLPKFIPGKKDGKKVAVKYGFPMSFALDQ